MSDLAARRREIFGVDTKPDPTTQTLVLFERFNQLTEDNENLTDSLAAATGALQMSEAKCAAERQRADFLQEQLGQVKADCASLVQALASRQEPKTETMVQAPPPVDIAALGAAIAASVVSALPTAVPPPTPKSWLLSTSDAMGNARKVRMTPEY